MCFTSCWFACLAFLSLYTLSLLAGLPTPSRSMVNLVRGEWWGWRSLIWGPVSWPGFHVLYLDICWELSLSLVERCSTGNIWGPCPWHGTRTTPLTQIYPSTALAPGSALAPSFAEVSAPGRSLEWASFPNNPAQLPPTEATITLCLPCGPKAIFSP